MPLLNNCKCDNCGHELQDRRQLIHHMTGGHKRVGKCKKMKEAEYITQGKICKTKEWKDAHRWLCSCGKKWVEKPKNHVCGKKVKRSPKCINKLKMPRTKSIAKSGEIQANWEYYQLDMRKEGRELWTINNIIDTGIYGHQDVRNAYVTRKRNKMFKGLQIYKKTFNDFLWNSDTANYLTEEYRVKTELAREKKKKADAHRELIGGLFGRLPMEEGGGYTPANQALLDKARKENDARTKKYINNLTPEQRKRYHESHSKNTGSDSDEFEVSSNESI